LAALCGFWVLRQMERWLHQHLFKVGWLLTKDFRTTTVLFYVLFLPGIVLHEVALFFAASFLNVRAERVLTFPQVQEIADLKLNFIRLPTRAPRWKIALIELAPPIVGIIAISAIANGILDISVSLSVMRTGDLDDIGAGFTLLTAKPDFWVWMYILFTVANTMTPRFTAQRALAPVLIIVGVAGVGLAAAGLLDQVLAPVIAPIAQVINVLAAVFGVTVGLNTGAIFFLGVIEQTIEYLTGNSAEFIRGRLVAKSRADILAERQTERERATRQKDAVKKRTPNALEGVPSIYRLPFPIPGAPEGRSATKNSEAVNAAPPPPKLSQVAAVGSQSAPIKPDAPLAPSGVLTDTGATIQAPPKENTSQPSPNSKTEPSHDEPPLLDERTDTAEASSAEG